MPDQEEVLQFLDELRQSGIVNMFGACPFVEAEFGVERSEAKRLLVQWMRTFAERHPPEEEKEQE